MSELKIINGPDPGAIESRLKKAIKKRLPNVIQASRVKVTIDGVTYTGNYFRNLLSETFTVTNVSGKGKGVDSDLPKCLSDGSPASKKVLELIKDGKVEYTGNAAWFKVLATGKLYIGRRVLSAF